MHVADVMQDCVQAGNIVQVYRGVPVTMQDRIAIYTVIAEIVVMSNQHVVRRHQTQWWKSHILYPIKYTYVFVVLCLDMGIFSSVIVLVNTILIPNYKVISMRIELVDLNSAIFVIHVVWVWAKRRCLAFMFRYHMLDSICCSNYSLIETSHSSSNIWSDNMITFDAGDKRN